MWAVIVGYSIPLNVAFIGDRPSFVCAGHGYYLRWALLETQLLYENLRWSQTEQKLKVCSLIRLHLVFVLTRHQPDVSGQPSSSISYPAGRNRLSIYVESTHCSVNFHDIIGERDIEYPAISNLDAVTVGVWNSKDKGTMRRTMSYEKQQGKFLSTQRSMKEDILSIIKGDWV